MREDPQGFTHVATNSVSPPLEPPGLRAHRLQPEAGTFLGRYELLMPVAQGGMAAVWAARLIGARGFQKIVAIKTILPSLCEDPRFEQMFLEEAALVARIHHPNVVQVLDLGEDRGLLYQVMEWLDGESLHTLLASQNKRGLPFDIAARIMIGACEGLHAAHELRDEAGRLVTLVHRDVSLQNILVTRDGVPKVVDFGVAKASALAGAETAAGVLKGKPSYMAPEQVRGDDLDRRADVFSLGVLLYILTTGHEPFRGGSAVVTLHNILRADAVEAPSLRRDGFPRALEHVLMTALDKTRDNRFATAAEMARAVEAAVPEVHAIADGEVAAFLHQALGDQLDRRALALRLSMQCADDGVRHSGAVRRPEAISTLRGMAVTNSRPETPPRLGAVHSPSSLSPNGTAPHAGERAQSVGAALSGGSRVAALGVGALVSVAAVGTLSLVVHSSSTLPRDGAAPEVVGEVLTRAPSAIAATRAPSTLASASPLAPCPASGQPRAVPHLQPARSERRPARSSHAEGPSPHGSSSAAPAVCSSQAPPASGTVRGMVLKIRDPGF